MPVLRVALALLQCSPRHPWQSQMPVLHASSRGPTRKEYWLSFDTNRCRPITRTHAPASSKCRSSPAFQEAKRSTGTANRSAGTIATSARPRAWPRSMPAPRNVLAPVITKTPAPASARVERPRARCVQACISKKDRCFTGECATRVANYRKMIDSNYGCKAKLSPLEICDRTVTCFQKCDAIKDNTQGLACMSTCKKKHAAGCNDVLLTYLDARNCFVFSGP